MGPPHRVVDRAPQTPQVPEDVKDSSGKHLNAQLDLNTSLLQRLHDAEQQHLQDQASTMNREALLAETRQLLNSLNDENAELREDVARSTSQVRDLSRELATRRAERETSEGSLKQLNYNLLHQIQSKNTLVEGLQQALDEKETKIAEGHSAMEAISSQLYETARERDELKREHASATGTIRAVEEQCSEALAKHARHLPVDSREKIGKREGSVDERLEAVLHGMVSKVLALEEAASRESQRSTQGETQVATLKSRLVAMDAACLDLRKQLDAKGKHADDNIGTLQKQLDESREANHTLALELVRCRQDFIGVMEEADRHSATLRQEYQYLVAELLQLETACDRAALQLGSQQVELGELQQSEAEGERRTLKLFQRATAAARRDAEDRVALRGEAEGARKKLQAERKRQEDTVRKLGQAHQLADQTQRESALLHTACQQLQVEQAGLEEAARRMQEDCQGAKAQCGDLQQQVGVLQGRLDTERAEAARDKEQRGRMQAELDRLRVSAESDAQSRTHVEQRGREQVQQLQEALEKMSDQLGKAKEVNEVLTEQRNAFKQENERFRKENDEQLAKLRERAVRALNGSPSRQPQQAPPSAPNPKRAQGPHTAYPGRLTGQVLSTHHHHHHQHQHHASSAVPSSPIPSLSAPSTSPSPDTQHSQARPEGRQSQSPARPPFAADSTAGGDHQWQLHHQRSAPRPVGRAARDTAAGSAAQAPPATQQQQQQTQQHYQAPQAAATPQAQQQQHPGRGAPHLPSATPPRSSAPPERGGTPHAGSAPVPPAAAPSPAAGRSVAPQQQAQSGSAAGAGMGGAATGDDDAFRQRVQRVQELDYYSRAQQALEDRLMATLREIQAA